MPETDDFREFMREIILRLDRTDRRLSAQLALAREESRRYLDRLDRKTDDLIAENQAQRQALYSIIDRLGNGGTAPAT